MEQHASLHVLQDLRFVQIYALCAVQHVAPLSSNSSWYIATAFLLALYILKQKTNPMWVLVLLCAQTVRTACQLLAAQV